MSSRSGCVGKAQNMGLNKGEAEELVNELLREKKRLEKSGDLTVKNFFDAWEAKAEAMKREAIAQERRTAQALLKYNELKDRIDAIKAQGVSSMDAIQAQLVGVSKYFEGARDSISYQREAIHRSWLSSLTRDLESIDSAIYKLIEKDKTFHDNVMREMREPKSTNSETARKVAEVFNKHLENTRQRLNAAGAEIGKLDDWCPQTHDVEKLMKNGEQGRQEWLDFMMNNLDFKRTFDGVGLVDKARAKRILENIYNTLTLGKNPHIDADFTRAKSGNGPSSLVDKLNKSRILHFKDAESAILYNDTYGNGSIFTAMTSNIEQAARALSILDRLGPEPDRNLKLIIAREKELIRNDTTLTQEQKKKQTEELDSAYSQGANKVGKIVNWMAELTGEASMPVVRMWAKVGSNFRALQSLAKLGAAPLSAVADIFIKSASIRAYGTNWPNAIANSVFQYFGRLQGDKRAIARECGMFVDNIVGDIAARWDADKTLNTTLSKWQNFMFKYNGLNWITERGKAGHTLYLSNKLGELSAKSFDDIDNNMRAILKYHGFNADKWEVMRKMVREADDGKLYFSPDAVDLLTDNDIFHLLPEKYKQYSKDLNMNEATWKKLQAEELENLRNKIRFDCMSMMIDETRFAIIEPDDATRALMRQGTRPGTPSGELWRAMTQFKSFPIAYLQKIFGGRRFAQAEKFAEMRFGYNRGAVKDALCSDIPGVIGFTISSIAFGYLAMCLKDISKGRNIRDITKTETFFAAAMQSGGLGIFGDFFFGKVDRYSNNFASDLAGPVIGSIGELVNIGAGLMHGEVSHAKDDAIRFAMNNMPFVNVWFTRLAMDWALLYHVREMLSPGTLKRTERKMKEEFNQTFMLPPSEYIKKGGFAFKKSLF